MKKFFALFSILVIAIGCQKTIGGNVITVSQNEFSVEGTGGEVNIETSGVMECSIVDYTRGNDIVNIRLHGTTPVSYNGGWYCLTSTDFGQNIKIQFEENPNITTRCLELSLTDGEQYAKVVINQLESR